MDQLKGCGKLKQNKNCSGNFPTVLFKSSIIQLVKLSIINVSLSSVNIKSKLSDVTDRFSYEIQLQYNKSYGIGFS